MNELKYGSLLNFVSIAVRLATSFFLTPYLLSCLGEGEYGLFVLVSSVLSWLALADMGMGGTVTKYMAEYKAKNQLKELAQFLGSAIALYSCISLVVLSAGILLYFRLGSLFPLLNAEQIDQFKFMYLLALGNMAMSFPLSAVGAVPNACAKFIVPKTVGLIVSILNTLVTVILLYFGYKAIALVVLNVVGNVVLMGWSLFYVLLGLKIKISWAGFDWELYKGMFKYSFWIFLNMIMNMLYWRTGNTIIAMTSGTQQISIFSVGIQFSQYFMMASTAVAGVFFAKIVGMVSFNSSQEALTRLMAKVGRIQALLLTVVLLGYLFYGHSFLTLWVGKTFGEKTIITWWIGLVVMLPLFVPLVQNLGIEILLAKNLQKGRALILFVTSVLNAILGYQLSLHYGAIGFAIGTGVSLLVGQGLLINRYYHRQAGLDMKLFWGILGRRFYLLLLVPSLFAWGMGFVFPADTWLNLGIHVVLFSGIYALCARLFYMNSEEIQLIPKPIRFSK